MLRFWRAGAPTTSAPDRNEFRTKLTTAIDRLLRAENFQQRSKGKGWRTTIRKIDVVDFRFLPTFLCTKWNVPIGSLTVDFGCFLPFVPSRKEKMFTCGRFAARRPREVACHVRMSVSKQICQRLCERAPNIWCPPEREQDGEAIIQDVLNAIRSKGLPFFAFVEDLEAFFEYLLSSDDQVGREGIWDIGKMGSFSRLYITGFTALELGRWVEAHKALLQCAAEAELMSTHMEQVGAVSGISSEVMSCIRHGIELAEGRSPLGPASIHRGQLAGR